MHRLADSFALQRGSCLHVNVDISVTSAIAKTGEKAGWGGGMVNHALDIKSPTCKWHALLPPILMID